ncbi:MAG: methyltransferase [Patescibacteria group bacterium]|nr:hypothetical protein [Patescibacteria group bacterium]MBU0879318.1 hypothetical protein [Patescibacteria group bacterium]MBU0880011.1 hypothetical protein [Patescibacteria group bacterium]MBU1062779.1 hypothetical protein [Patescibacteria group bacterium]MBU1783387.1 hypothetical protein [Patescibacteria group bacterium]
MGTGIVLSFILSIFISDKLKMVELTDVLKIISPLLFFSFGIIFIIIFSPLFILGLYFLGPMAATGLSNTLKENGIYKYIRDPMYSGLIFTIIGIGLILNKISIVLAGIILFLFVFIQCKREEKELEKKFHEKYINYRSRTPMFIPNIKLMIKDKQAKLKVKSY